MKNKKTTIAGVLTIFVTIAKLVAEILGGQPYDLTSTVTGVTAGVGLILAKDHNVTGGTVAVPTVPNFPTLPAETK